METLFTILTVIVFLVWGYVFYLNIKAYREFKNETGINLFSPIQFFKFHFRKKTEEQKLAHKKLIQRGNRAFLIWFIAVLSLVLLMLLLGNGQNKSSSGKSSVDTSRHK